MSPGHANKDRWRRRSHARTGIGILLYALLGVNLLAAGEETGDKAFSLELGVKLHANYDSNIWLQDVAPDPANVAIAKADGLTAVDAKRGSWVSGISPFVDLTYAPSDAFKLQAGYEPCIYWYHNARTEDHVTNRWSLRFSGQTEETNWDQTNSFTLIDGNHLGPTFARPGSIPSIGGIPMRNRRDAFIYIGTIRWDQKVNEKWLIRPMAKAYVHDFRTEQRPKTAATTPFYVYENYVDRSDLCGGIDVGYLAAPDTYLLLGYRYGQQDQGKLLGVNSPLDNTYHRVLVGAEGSPAEWLQLSFLLGPDFRSYETDAPAGSGQSEVLLYADANISLLPTERDTITYFWRQYKQPAFGGFSMYEDLTNEVSWNHEFNEHWSASAAFRLYIGDFSSMINRDDWIYTPRAAVGYHNDELSAELAYSYDWTESRVDAADNSGREFTRHFISFTLKYRL